MQSVKRENEVFCSLGYSSGLVLSLGVRYWASKKEPAKNLSTAFFVIESGVQALADKTACQDLSREGDGEIRTVADRLQTFVGELPQ